MDGLSLAHADPDCKACGGTGLVPSDHCVTVDIFHGANEEGWIHAYRDGTIV
jgi:hypothetical protein